MSGVDVHLTDEEIGAIKYMARRDRARDERRTKGLQKRFGRATKLPVGLVERQRIIEGLLRKVGLSPALVFDFAGGVRRGEFVLDHSAPGPEGID